MLAAAAAAASAVVALRLLEPLLLAAAFELRRAAAAWRMISRVSRAASARALSCTSGSLQSVCTQWLPRKNPKREHKDRIGPIRDVTLRVHVNQWTRNDVDDEEEGQKIRAKEGGRDGGEGKERRVSEYSTS